MDGEYRSSQHDFRNQFSHSRQPSSRRVCCPRGSHVGEPLSVRDGSSPPPTAYTSGNRNDQVLSNPQL